MSVLPYKIVYDEGRVRLTTTPIINVRGGVIDRSD